MRVPETFALWRTLAWQALGDPLANLRYFLVTGSWFAWPAWPLALWTLWSLRRRLLEPQLFVPAAALLLMFASLLWWSPAQSIALIPLLAPLALFAAQVAVAKPSSKPTKTVSSKPVKATQLKSTSPKSTTTTEAPATTIAASASQGWPPTGSRPIRTRRPKTMRGVMITWATSVLE